MAVRPRNAKLETRNARRALPTSSEVYWSKIHPKLFIGYRKGSRGASWCYRIGLEGGGYKKGTIGTVDDISDANGIGVFSYDQAVTKAMEAANTADRQSQSLDYTVGNAIDDYLEWYRVKTKDPKQTELMVNRHIKPKFEKYRVADLKPKSIRAWHLDLAKTDNPDSDKQRARKATANRVLTVFKAILNKAWENDNVGSRDAWSRVKPFKNIEPPKPPEYKLSDLKRLINKVDSEFRPMASAALLCGGRYGELNSVRVNAFNAKTGKVTLFGKDEEERTVPLTVEGVALFTQHCAGKKGDDFIFTRNGGEPWGRSQQTRRMKAACKDAEITPEINFKALRKTYGQLLAMNNVSLKVIAELMGHSDTRITEKHYAHIYQSHIDKDLRDNLPDFGFEKTNVVEI